MHQALGPFSTAPLSAIIQSRRPVLSPTIIVSRSRGGTRQSPRQRYRQEPAGRWHAASLALVVLSLLLAGCAHTYTYGEAADGQTVQVQQGDSVVLQLSESPGTGYHWVITQQDSAWLPLQSQDYTPNSSGTIGGSGTESFTFKAAQSGTVSLALQYQGPQVQNPRIAGTFSLTVQIT